MSTDFLIWYIIPLSLLFLFFISYKVNRTKLTTGVLLSCSVALFTGIFFVQAYYSGSRMLRTISALPLLFLIFVLTFGAYILIAFLFLNTRSILRKEKRDLKHLLALFLAIGLLIIIAASRFLDVTRFPETLQYFMYSMYGLILYYLFHLSQFLINIILCNFSRPRKDQHYLIVLGCWIQDGKVPPLLARRIDKAISFYNRQKALREPPKLLLSGGKGSDETCSEAEAMKAYALEKGIPEEHLLLETNSTSTLENMKFSKEIMDRESKGEPYRCIYVTNNYHLLRAGIFARRAGLNINGIGAKTAFYYLPNAVLREYIAYTYLHLKWNIVFGVFSLLFGSFVLPVLHKYLFEEEYLYKIIQAIL